MGPFDFNKDELQNPFGFSYEKFSKLDRRQRDYIFDRAKDISLKFVQEYFKQNPQIKWVIITKSNNQYKIIAEGNYDDEPGQGFIGKIAKDLNIVPFTFADQSKIKPLPVRYIPLV